MLSIENKNCSIVLRESASELNRVMTNYLRVATSNPFSTEEDERRDESLENKDNRNAYKSI